MSDGVAGQAAVLTQLLRLTRAVMDARAAAHDAGLARTLRTSAEGDLQQVHARLASADAIADKVAAQAPPASPAAAAPTPAPLSPEQERIRASIRVAAGATGSESADAELVAMLARQRAAFPAAAGTGARPAAGEADTPERGSPPTKPKEPDRGRGRD